MAQDGRVFGDLSIDCLSPPSGNNHHPLQTALELLMPHSHLNSDTVFPVLLQHITLIDRRHSGASIFMAGWGTFMRRKEKKRKSSLLSSVPDGPSEDEGRLVWGRATTFYMGWDKKWEHVSARSLSVSVR